MDDVQKSKILGLGLISGGLDSLIATLILKLQGIDVVGLNFKSPFCICDKAYKNAECGLNLYYEKLSIKIFFLQKGNDYLKIIRNPKFGYGRNLNPCIDCRIYILKKARELAREIDADFIFTGEVLNQRPKSQNLKALKIVEKESGLIGELLRPLSAKLLKPTKLEQEGLIDRNKLLGIKGRSRNTQLELARKHDLLQNYYACSGCLLTNKNFASRMKDYLKYNKDIKIEDVRILKYGRHFRYKNAKIIIGRDEFENSILMQLKKNEDIMMVAKNVVGPVTIIKGPIDEEILQLAASFTLRYSDSKGSEGQVWYAKDKSHLDNLITTKIEDDEIIKNFIL